MTPIAIGLGQGCSLKSMRLFLICMGFTACIALLFTAIVSPVLAQSKSVIVQRRDGEIAILTNGDVQVTETWVVQFIGGPFHFAFRNIALNRVTDIFDWGVSEDSRAYEESNSEAPNTFRISDDGGEKSIRWCFSETTNQARTFILRYTLHGALRIADHGDQFFWNFIESGREYTINSTHIVVHLPVSFDTSQLQATTYQDGTESTGVRVLDGQKIEITGGPFAAGVEWAIRVQFPHGVVHASPPAWQAIEEKQQATETQRRAQERQATLIGFWASLAILIGGATCLFLLWYVRIRKPQTPGFLAEYFPQPPENLSPAVAGILLDENADMPKIVATIIDLARRGYMRLVDERAGSPLELTFIKLDHEHGDLRDYEREVLGGIFGLGGLQEQQKLSDLRQNYFSLKRSLQGSLYDEALKTGYFKINPGKRRATLNWIFIVVLFLLFVIDTLFGWRTPWIWSTFSVFLVYLGLFLILRAAGTKTSEGEKAAAKWRTFKQYLTEVDRYAQSEGVVQQFEPFLPYAIAFGVEQNWVEKFTAMNAPVPDWYNDRILNAADSDTAHLNRDAMGSRFSDMLKTTTEVLASSWRSSTSGSFDTAIAKDRNRR